MIAVPTHVELIRISSVGWLSLQYILEVKVGEAFTVTSLGEELIICRFIYTTFDASPSLPIPQVTPTSLEGGKERKTADSLPY
jgi:hypothetical protein